MRFEASSCQRWYVFDALHRLGGLLRVGNGGIKLRVKGGLWWRETLLCHLQRHYKTGLLFDSSTIESSLSGNFDAWQRFL